jgi:hypothetical protein
VDKNAEFLHIGGRSWYIKNFTRSWALVAHVYNNSYSGGRDQEDQGLKRAWANSLQEPILEIPNTKNN